MSTRTAPDQSFFVVMIDFGRNGQEANVDPNETRQSIKDRIIAGDYVGPVSYVHEYNPAEGTSRDITEDLARELFDELSDQRLPDFLASFIEAHCEDRIALAVRRAA